MAARSCILFALKRVLTCLITEFNKCLHATTFSSFIVQTHPLQFFERDGRAASETEFGIPISMTSMNWLLLIEKSAIATSEFLGETMDMELAIPYCNLGDNGGKFTGKLFREVLSMCGIILKTTQVRTPQQNGKIERLGQNIKLAQNRDHLNSILDEYTVSGKTSSQLNNPVTCPKNRNYPGC
jgi:hypothetical protein